MNLLSEVESASSSSSSSSPLGPSASCQRYKNNPTFQKYAKGLEVNVQDGIVQGVQGRWQSAIPLGTTIVYRNYPVEMMSAVYQGQGQVTDTKTGNTFSLSQWCQYVDPRNNRSSEKNQADATSEHDLDFDNTKDLVAGKISISAPQACGVLLKDKADKIHRIRLKMFDFVFLECVIDSSSFDHDKPLSWIGDNSQSPVLKRQKFCEDDYIDYETRSPFDTALNVTEFSVTSLNVISKDNMDCSDCLDDTKDEPTRESEIPMIQEPMREEGTSPLNQEGKSPMSQEGKSPMSQEGTSPMSQEGTSPMSQEGTSPMRQKSKAMPPPPLSGSKIPLQPQTRETIVVQTQPLPVITPEITRRIPVAYNGTKECKTTDFPACSERSVWDNMYGDDHEGICIICDATKIVLSKRDRTQLCHVNPRCKLGRNDVAYNYIFACTSCNNNSNRNLNLFDQMLCNNRSCNLGILVKILMRMYFSMYANLDYEFSGRVDFVRKVYGEVSQGHESGISYQRVFKVLEKLDQFCPLEEHMRNPIKYAIWKCQNNF